MLPTKSKDPGSFTLPVTIGSLAIGNSLLDLGASINLMPLSMLQRIGDLEVKPTRMTLQLADRSVKYPHGIVEDVLVNVDLFLFPANFAVMDIEENIDVPLILGRPFMKTTRVLIDVDDGKLKVRVNDEEVSFDVFDAMHYPKDKSSCFRVDSTSMKKKIKRLTAIKNLAALPRLLDCKLVLSLANLPYRERGLESIMGKNLWRELKHRYNVAELEVPELSEKDAAP
ncbi:uncharacterized protein LOC109788842 [Cajanus cajan]|uniref:uncharacterized protein LOC109788842 n=1 Tax=Cajanus cajan TaxID=3821 RepID=UPI00098DC0E0|nr:uncharacterized protein LOC109788842 [Cajanus cajan]